MRERIMGSLVEDPKGLDTNQGEDASHNAPDFSQPSTFDLRTRKPDKTVDIGRDGVSLSLDSCGRILQASTFHPEHGIIVAVPFEQFDGARFYDAAYVRNYRTRMLQMIKENKPGFGLQLGSDVKTVAIQILHANVVRFTLEFSTKLNIDVDIEVSTNGEIWQTATATNTSSKLAAIPYALSLCISLNRASYGQLTEGGPIALPESRNILKLEGLSTININNPALGAQLGCILEAHGSPIDLSGLSEQDVHNAPLDATVPGVLSVQAGTTAMLRARFRLLPDVGGYMFPQLDDSSCQQVKDDDSPWKRKDNLTTYIVRRNVDYILANCTVPISDSATCIITDHVALPLGWNRDNYWQLRLLQETQKHSDILLNINASSSYSRRICATLKGHLNWAFRVAQRPHGFWHRSYLVTGRPKDKPIFQLDQQCYPLLELCDYLEYFPSEEDFIKELLELGVVEEIVSLLEEKRDASTGLWPTDETPGDDAVIYPYHFSSHILLWRTMSRLRDLYAHIYSPSHPQVERLTALSDDLRARTFSAFSIPHPDTYEQVFAYLTDGAGKHTFYHDGNDIPTLFAPEWKFVSSPSELSTWHNTMAFGLSPANTQGYCNEGLYPGLGSVHSPGTWTLGLFQELAYAAYCNDEKGMKEAWRKISAAMQWDGTFSEAIDPHTGECSSKAWFSWPGAMIGALLIEMRKEGLEDLLLDGGETCIVK